MRKYIILSALAVLTTTFIVAAGVGTEKLKFPKYSARVKLQITAPEEIRNQIDSYISRELRSLGDVQIITDEPDFVISVLAIVVDNRAGYKAGFALTDVILRPCQNKAKFWKMLFGQSLSEKQYATLEGMTADLYRFEDQHIRVSALTDLQGVCQEMVADFDTKHLKSEREWQQRVEKEIENAASKNTPQKK